MASVLPLRASQEHTLSVTGKIGLFKEIVGANVRSPRLPYKVTFVATYHCNFRCQMCNIWQKKSVDEMTPDEVAHFFERWQPGGAVQRVPLHRAVDRSQCAARDFRHDGAGQPDRPAREHGGSG